MNRISYTIRGASPLLMHSCAGVNPLHPITKEIKKLTAKKKKTDEDLQLISDLEYQSGIYFDEKIGPYVPAEMMEACLRDAAKRTKQGKNFTMAVMVSPDMIPLIYDGTRELSGLIGNIAFRDSRPATVNRNKVMRTRPRFNSWSLKFDLEYSPDIIESSETITEVLKTAGAYIGLGDYRPRYGRFEIIEVKNG